MAAELPRPGVSVIQEFRTVSPSVVTPTLVPCVVGACRQIVEVLNGTALNTSSKVALPVFFTATDASLVGVRYVYTGLSGKSLYLSVDNSPFVEIAFTSSSMTPAAVVDAINTALNNYGVFGALAEVKQEYGVGGDLIEKTWTLRTVAPGELEKIEVGAATDPAVWASLGLKPGWLFTGLDMYNGAWMDIPWVSFPDPRHNLSELTVDPDSLRVFFAANAQNLRELSRTAGFCRRGANVYAYDDGDGDALTPFVDMPVQDFGSTAVVAHMDGSKTLTPAALVSTGAVDITTADLYIVGPDPGDLAGLTFILDGVTVSIPALGLANKAALLALAPAGYTFTEAGTSHFLIITKTAGTGSLNIGAGTVNAVLGLTTAVTYPALVGFTLELGGNRPEQTFTFRDDTVFPMTDTDSILAQLNAFFEDFTFEKSADKLIIKTVDKGQDANITIGGTSLLALGLMTYEGTVDINTAGLYGAGTLTGKTVMIDGESLTFGAGSPATKADLLAQLNAFFTDYTFSEAHPTGFLHIVRNTNGDFIIGNSGAGTANTALGLTASTVTAYTAGVAYPALAGDELFVEGRSLGAINQVAPGAVVSRLRLNREVAMTAHAQITGTVDLVTLVYTGLNGKNLKIDGVNLAFGAAEFPVSTGTDEDHLLALINTTFPGFTTTASVVGATHLLHIEKTTGSGPFTLNAPAADPANATLGLAVVETTYNPLLGTNFYIVAKNLIGNALRPTPELVINSGVPQLMHDLLRETDGTPSSAAKTYTYMMYKALRKDVSTAADKPGLLSYDSTAQVTEDLAPISVENPLALGLYFALLNCPGAQVTGIGVDEIAADMPEGTVEAFTRAAEFLEAVEVYAIAPLTHDKTVGEVFNVHVTTMSAPENKGERIVLFNSETPTHELDTLVTSGAAGNSLGTNIFDTGVANLSTLLVAAGIPNPIGGIAADLGVYLDVASDSKRYSIDSVSGSVVTIRLVFTGGDNDDGFYAETPDQFPPSGVPLIDETFAVKIRGAALTLPTGKPDKAGIAVTMQQYGQTFGNRRFWHIFPDKCAATLGGVEQVLEGYYMCAGYVGLIAGQPPQQSFTNFPLTGFTRVMGSSDTFGERQLNIMAAGGNFIVVQDTQNSPLVSRMALTTDMTSVETRTDSITKVVDFTAKIMRRGFKNFIGRFNVTQGFIDSLGHVGQGILTFLQENGVLIGGSLNNIIQDESAPDTVLIDATLDPPYPCNYIRLTLVI